MTARKKPLADVAQKRAIVDAALPLAASDGFTGQVLSRAATACGTTKAQAARLFPGGAASLVEAASTFSDFDMEEELSRLPLAQMKVRERISAAVKIRLAMIRPHKDAARRAAAFLSLPPNLPLATKLLYNTVDCMWRATGDTSTNFNFYTKRAILAGVYASTLARWLNDKSEGERETSDFLAARIENVMQFERLKADVSGGLSRVFSQLTATATRQSGPR